MKIVEKVALILVIVGGLNWGLVGLLDLNVVTTVLGDGTLTKVVYDLIGLSALVAIYTSLMKKD